MKYKKLQEYNQLICGSKVLKYLTHPNLQSTNRGDRHCIQTLNKLLRIVPLSQGSRSNLACFWQGQRPVRGLCSCAGWCNSKKSCKPLYIQEFHRLMKGNSCEETCYVITTTEATSRAGWTKTRGQSSNDTKTSQYRLCFFLSS